MKTWKKKIRLPKLGVCIVKEASDKESNGKIAPVSHGFVNLYQNRKWVAWCGTFYAERHIING